MAAHVVVCVGVNIFAPFEHVGHRIRPMSRDDAVGPAFVPRHALGVCLGAVPAEPDASIPKSNCQFSTAF